MLRQIALTLSRVIICPDRSRHAYGGNEEPAEIRPRHRCGLKDVGLYRSFSSNCEAQGDFDSYFYVSFISTGATNYMYILMDPL